MTAQECITQRRSIRKFKADPIDHQLVSDIIADAAFAPSWKNTQITRYIAVEGALKDRVAEEATKAWPGNGAIIAAAPMLIVITVIKNRSGFERDGSYTTCRGDGWQMFDAGVATQTFSLAAYEKGIGSVIMGIFDPAIVADILQVPEDREVIALVPIGYPDEEPSAPRRKTVEELVSFQ